MKKTLFILLFLLLAGTGFVHALVVARSPEEMIESAQFILAGEVVDVRKNQEQREFTVRVDTVYKGELGAAMITIPLPPNPQTSSSSQWTTPPEKGNRLLFFFTVNELYRFVPAADLNWAAVLRDGKADALFMGAGYNSWTEADYLGMYNRFLAETPGTAIPPAEDGGGEESETAKHPGSVSPLVFFALAGVFFVVLVVTGRRKKRSTL